MTSALQNDVRHDTALYADSAINSAFDSVVNSVREKANEIIGSSDRIPLSTPIITNRVKKSCKTSTILMIVGISLAALIVLALSITLPLCLLL